MREKFKIICPSCREDIVEIFENNMVYKKCIKCEWVGMKFSNIVNLEPQECEYCETDIDNRKNLFVIESDYEDYEIYIDGNNNLSSDFPFGVKINYCPICGRKIGVVI